VFNKKQKRVEDLQTLRDITDDVLEDEFVPYACLFNENTILTKNGELLQTIVIRNPLQGSKEDAPSLREYLRDAVAKHIPSPRFALWFHTVRKKVDVTAPGNFSNKFAYALNKNWSERNRFADQYATYVYISIVREGEAIPLMRPQAFLRGIFPFAEINHRNEYLENIHQELNKVTQNLIQALRPFGAQILGSTSKTNKRGEKNFYSEQMQFLERIINLEERPMPFTNKALDKYLTNGEVTFGFNAMEVRTPKGNRRFGALLTIKEYKEASLGALDRFLMLPIDYIVTQCVDFINSEDALKNYKTQGYFADLGNDPKLQAQTEIDKILDSDNGKSTDFGQQQTTIFILADELIQLERDVLLATRHLCNVGVIVVREDIHFEECYWAQLPGNFEFLRRLRPTSTHRIAGFANTPPFVADTSADDKWGFPISSFHTANGMPYCLHLHDGDNPNSSIFGQNIRYVTRISHFLLTQATKYKPQIFYVDSIGRGRAIAKELGLRSWQPAEGLNPFILPDNPSNQAFLLRWLGIIARISGKKLPPEAQEAIKTTIADIMRLPQSKRSFALFLARVAEKSLATASAFADWGSNGKYGYLLQADGSFNLADNPYFDFSNLMEVPPARIVLASWVLQYITANITEKRSILLLSDVFALLADTHILASLPAWFGFLKKNDCALLLASGEIESAFNNPILPTIFSEMANRFFLPDPLPDAAYATIAQLDETQFNYLDMMEAEAGHFLLCQRKQTIVGTLDPDIIAEHEETIAGDPPSNFGLSSKADISSAEEQEEDISLW